MREPSRGFTLIELLVVIAIIAILAVVVILTLNPAELLRQSRDSSRLSDMATLNSALGVYASQGGTSFGTANTIYSSVADPSATSTAGDQCQGLGLPTPPATYSYHCSASTTYRTVTGSGWMPVNFSSIPTGAPFGDLPIDPVNQTSSRFYYTYETNGTQFEVTSVMESAKYQLGGSADVISSDGGVLASVYEKGTLVGMEPLDYGDSSLLGYWPLNENTGSTAYDDSGNNVTGTWQGATIGGSHYTTGKVGTYAGNFSTANTNIVSTTLQYSVSSAAGFSWSAWVYLTNVSSTVALIGNRFGSTWTKITPTAFEYNTGGIIAYTVPTSTWQFLTVTKSGSNFTYYDNGAVVGTTTNTNAVSNMSFYIAGDANFPTDHTVTGMINDVRLYTRALSSAQVQAMYNGGK